MIRVVLPHHLRTLANVGKEIQVAVEGPVTQHTVLDAVEAAYPVLRGTIRDMKYPEATVVGAVLRRWPGSVARAAGCSASRCRDFSSGAFLIVGAMAGG